MVQMHSKLRNEIVQEHTQEQINTSVANEEIIHSNSLETESVVEDSSVNEMEKSFTQEAMDTTQEQTVEESIQEDVNNDLKEFGVDSDAPDLFSSETENSSSEDLLSSSDEEDDDLEIPAFLRRQKN
jgi:cell division protein FtsZ